MTRLAILDAKGATRTMAGDPFDTTRWSIVLAARDQPTAVSRKALTTLCETYWPPLYAYIRRRGYSIEEAQDLTQEFFTRFLEKDYLGDVNQDRGLFRAYLLACLKHFLANEWDKSCTKKRGGDLCAIPLDFAILDNAELPGFADELTPERLYERRWALTLLDRVLARLERRYADSGNGALFDRLQSALRGDGQLPPYEYLAKDLGMSEGAVKVAVHRMRRRYRDLLREEVANTVEDEEAVGEELRYLFSALTL